MSGHDDSVFFDKKIVIRRPDHPSTPHIPLRPIASLFFLTSSPPSKWTSYVYHPLLYVNSVQYTVWKVSVFGFILVRIFQHSDWLQKDTEYPFNTFCATPRKH